MADKHLQIIISAKDHASRPVLGIQRAFGKLGGTLGGFRRLAGGALGALGVGVGTAGLVLGLRSIVKEGAAFGYTMSRVGALTGATGAEMDQLREKARQLGRDTKFTAVDAGEAMSFFALAGYSTGQILKSIEPTLHLAAAGQMDIATSADIAAKIMAGFGIEADNLGPAVDVLAKAFTTSNTDLRQLGDAMKYVGPVARTAGLDFNETVAAVQMLSNAGIQGEMAGTTLRGAIIALANPTLEARKMLDELGISVQDAQGNFLPLANILGQFQAKLAGTGTAERLNVLGEIFEKRAGAGFAVLLEQGPAELQRFVDLLGRARGTAKQIAEDQEDNLSGDWTKFTSAISEVQIGLETMADGPLRDVVQWATKWTNIMGVAIGNTKLWWLNMQRDSAQTALSGIQHIRQWAVGGQSAFLSFIGWLRGAWTDLTVDMALALDRAGRAGAKALLTALHAVEGLRQEAIGGVAEFIIRLTSNSDAEVNERLRLLDLNKDSEARGRDQRLQERLSALDSGGSQFQGNLEQERKERLAAIAENTRRNIANIDSSPFALEGVLQQTLAQLDAEIRTASALSPTGPEGPDGKPRVAGGEEEEGDGGRAGKETKEAAAKLPELIESRFGTGDIESARERMQNEHLRRLDVGNKLLEAAVKYLASMQAGLQTASI